MPRDPRREFLYLADIIDSALTVARWLAERGDQWEIAAKFGTDDGDEADDNGPDSESGASQGELTSP